MPLLFLLWSVAFSFAEEGHLEDEFMNSDCDFIGYGLNDEFFPLDKSRNLNEAFARPNYEEVNNRTTADVLSRELYMWRGFETLSFLNEEYRSDFENVHEQIDNNTLDAGLLYLVPTENPGFRSRDQVIKLLGDNPDFVALWIKAFVDSLKVSVDNFNELYRPETLPNIEKEYGCVIGYRWEERNYSLSSLNPNLMLNLPAEIFLEVSSSEAKSIAKSLTEGNLWSEVSEETKASLFEKAIGNYHNFEEEFATPIPSLGVLLRQATPEMDSRFSYIFNNNISIGELVMRNKVESVLFHEIWEAMGEVARRDVIGYKFFSLDASQVLANKDLIRELLPQLDSSLSKKNSFTPWSTILSTGLVILEKFEGGDITKPQIDALGRFFTILHPDQIDEISSEHFASFF